MTINNNNIFGVFTLNEARGSRLTGDWLHTDTVANYGWFGGGFSFPIYYSTVDRIDFSNDSPTASVRGPLSSARYNPAATGNSNYGWFGSGLIPGSVVSTVDRIDFSNDAATASVRGPLSLAKVNLASTGNSNYGWFGGGSLSPGIPSFSTVDRIDFSNDSSTASVRGPLSLARSGLAATGNSNYGWFGGGIVVPGTYHSIVDRIDFSNDNLIASPRSPLSRARNFLSATGNSNYGWFGGGDTPGGTTTVDRIDFSNDSSTTSVRGPLSSARLGMGSVRNSNYGWFGGGTSTVDRINFSNDSVTASPRGNLSLGRTWIAATSGVLNIRRQKAGNYGWWGGGILFPSVPSPALSTVDRIDFANDSVAASPRGTLSLARHGLAATGNSNYGWFGGGRLPGSPQPTQYSRVDRIDFSNDSASASVRGPLSLGRDSLAATGNSNYGWFGGGTNPSFSSVATVDRIDFSNDSSTALQRGPFSSAKTEITATGNSNYGWFGVGFPTIVERIDFSNDSSTALSRGSIPYRYNVAATGNSNYGWFGGGFTPTTVSTVNRIDFSNDSPTASVRGPLSLARQSLAATGNSNYGWFGGGWFSPSTPQINYSIVDRIDFSNDSVTAVARSLLTGARYAMVATSNTPIG